MTAMNSVIDRDDIGEEMEVPRLRAAIGERDQDQAVGVAH
jgi:hypothetical protein